MDKTFAKPLLFFMVILIIVLLQNCTTTDKKEEQKPSIQNVIEGLKGIKLP